MSSPRYVVVKVGTGKSNPREADAVDSLNDVSFPPDDHPGRAMIPSLRDRFVLNGPNGTYPCYMTAPAQSSVAAVKEASDQYLFQNGTARSIIAQLVQAAEYMHARGFVHGGKVLRLIPIYQANVNIPINLQISTRAMHFYVYLPTLIISQSSSYMRNTASTKCAKEGHRSNLARKTSTGILSCRSQTSTL